MVRISVEKPALPVSWGAVRMFVGTGGGGAPGLVRTTVGPGTVTVSVAVMV